MDTDPCGEWEERIALYAGGDVADAAVERHLAECPGCQVFASGMRQTVEMLRAERVEIGAAHYAAVRARVLAEVARPRRRWVWALAAAGAVCLLIAAGVVEVERAMRVEALPARVAAAPGAPAVQASAVVAKARPKRAVRPREQVVVKLETDVPDVVIYWIADTRGELR